MRHDVPEVVATMAPGPRDGGASAVRWSGRSVRGRRSIRCLRLLAVALGGLAIAAPAASALVFVHGASKRVALIPGNAPAPRQGPNGIMPVSSFVSGRKDESFDRFSFSSLSLNQITRRNLSRYDTVALIQVKTANLTAQAQTALAQFVARGGKLLIHDSDETGQGDYSWLLGGPYSTVIGRGCLDCGATAGTTTITNSSLASTNPADPSYVNLREMGRFTDALGDSNLLVSTDPRWFALGTGSNVRREAGAQIAWASHNNGLIVYNGFDTDFIKTRAGDAWRCDVRPAYTCPNGTPTVDWLAQMWYSELSQPWGTPGGGGGGAGLPFGKPVVAVGTPLAPYWAGLPSRRRCVASRTLVLRLKRLVRVPHRRIVDADVYVNRRHVDREGRPFAGVTLTRLPRHGTYTITVIATSSRGYHYNATRHYQAC